MKSKILSIFLQIENIIIVVLCSIIGYLCFQFYQLYNPPLVSVVMSTYNRHALLPRAINSILNQTYQNFEFIIIDDGSTDGTAKLLKSYAQKDKRIRVLTNPGNKGLVYSLNRGLEAARGKYIARMDDDDLSLPVRFQVQVAFLERNPDITVVGSAHTSINRDMVQVQSERALIPYRIRPYDASDMAIISYFNVPIFHPSAMIRRDFIEKHHIRYEARFESAEDTPFWHAIVLKGGSIIKLPTPLIQRGDSAKKKNYHRKQIESFHLFLDESLKGMVPPHSFKGWILSKEICFILNRMKDHINRKPGITEEGLLHLYKKENCQ